MHWSHRPTGEFIAAVFVNVFFVVAWLRILMFFACCIDSSLFLFASNPCLFYFIFHTHTFFYSFAHFHRPAPDQSFRPGGILPAKTNTFIRTDVVKPNTSRNNKKTMGSSGSTNALGSINLQNLNLNVLNEELKRTEEAMQRQQLKIKLNTKQPKRFEVAKNEGRKSTKNDVDSPY